MKVAQLIAELSKLPPEAPVEIWSPSVEDWWEVGTLHYDPDDPNTTSWPNETPSVRLTT